MEALFPHKPVCDRKERIPLESISEMQCEQLFRHVYSWLVSFVICSSLDNIQFPIKKRDLSHLCTALNLPDFYRGQGTKASRLEALLIMLCKLAYPDRWCHLVWLFRRAEPVIDDIHRQFKHLLESLDVIWLNPELFFAAVHKKRAALCNCLCFIDDTARPIARPTQNQ